LLFSVKKRCAFSQKIRCFWDPSKHVILKENLYKPGKQTANPTDTSQSTYFLLFQKYPKSPSYRKIIECLNLVFNNKGKVL